MSLVQRNKKYIVSGELLILLDNLLNLYKENLQVDAEHRGVLIGQMFQVYMKENLDEVK